MLFEEERYPVRQMLKYTGIDCIKNIWYDINPWRDAFHIPEDAFWGSNRSMFQILACFPSLHLVLATGPNSLFSFGSSSNPEPNRRNRFPHKTQNFNTTTLPPIKYLSSDRIMIWSVCRLCIWSRSFTSRSQICDPTNIRSVAIENPLISLKFALFPQPLNKYQSDR